MSCRFLCCLSRTLHAIELLVTWCWHARDICGDAVCRLAGLNQSSSTVIGCGAGDVLLDGLRVNQLKLSKQLAGSLQVSDREVHMHAKVSTWQKPYCYGFVQCELIVGLQCVKGIKQMLLCCISVANSRSVCQHSVILSLLLYPCLLQCIACICTWVLHASLGVVLQLQI